MKTLLEGLAELLIKTIVKGSSDEALKTTLLIENIPTLFSNRALYLKTLLYIYYENDGAFTKEEKKAIKMQCKKEANFYTDKEYKILKDITQKKPTSRGIRHFVDKYGIHLVTIERTTTIIEDICKDTKTTIRAIERLKIDLI